VGQVSRVEQVSILRSCASSLHRQWSIDASHSRTGKQRGAHVRQQETELASEQIRKDTPHGRCSRHFSQELARSIVVEMVQEQGVNRHVARRETIADDICLAEGDRG